MEREWVQLIGFSQESDYARRSATAVPPFRPRVLAANWQEDAVSGSFLQDGFGNFA